MIGTSYKPVYQIGVSTRISEMSMMMKIITLMLFHQVMWNGKGKMGRCMKRSEKVFKVFTSRKGCVDLNQKSISGNF